MHVYYRIQTPSNRLSYAMERITRNKWIPGSEVRRIGLALAKKVSYMPTRTYDAAIRSECYVIGMINGGPPCYFHERCYENIVAAVKHNEKKGEIAVLIAILRYIHPVGYTNENNSRFANIPSRMF